VLTAFADVATSGQPDLVAHIPFVLQRFGGMSVIAANDSQDDNLGALGNFLHCSGQLVGTRDSVKTPVKVDHAFVFSRLIRLGRGDRQKLTADRGELGRLADPHDDGKRR
jgi:hypothetical protein